MSVMNQEKLSKYLRVQSSYQPVSLPNRNAFIFITKKTGTPQAWIWDEEAGTRQFTDFSDRIMHVYVSPNGAQLIAGSDHNGNEKEQFYLLDADGENVEELVVSPEHFHHFGGWSPDGNQIAFSSNRRNPGFFDVYTVDVLTKETKIVYEYDGNCQPVTWLKDGKHLVLTIQETNLDSSVYILNIESGEMIQLGGIGAKARFQSIRFTSEGYGYILADKDEDTLALYGFKGEQPEDLKQISKNDQWDIEQISVSPDEKNLLFTVNEGGHSTIHMLETETGDSRKIEGYPNGVVESLSWLNGNQFIFSLKSPVLPGDIWRYDVTERKSDRITHFGKNEEIEKNWIEPVLASYISFDGLKVPYFFYGELGSKKPVIIYVHGGPEHQIRAEFNPVIQYLASEGFNVVAPNVRGSMGYGRKYVQLDDKRKRMDAVADLASLAEELIRIDSADPESIGIMGRSYGGFMVLAALTHYPDIWAAGVDIVGISHFKTFLQNTGAWRRKLREFEYGSLAEDGEFFDEIAPLNHSKSITAPLLIFHGRNDTRVPVTEAEQLFSDMKDAGKEVGLIIFEDEGHQTEKLENHIHMHSKTIEFMRRHLEKAKVEQQQV